MAGQALSGIHISRLLLPVHLLRGTWEHPPIHESTQSAVCGCSFWLSALEQIWSSGGIRSAA